MRSLAVPFNIVGGSVADTTDFDLIIEQKIINVLVTGKFERTMLPDYGGDVQALLFDAIDELVEVDFKTDAEQELTSNVSGISIIDISVEETNQSEARITVYYRTPLSPARSTVFTLPLGILTEESEL